MVVMLLVVLASTAIIMGLNAVTHAEVRNGAMELVAAARFAYSRATSQGNTVRLHFDLDRHTLALEEAHGHHILARSGDPLREEEGDGIVDPWRAARAQLENTFEPSLGSTSFSPITGREDVILDKYRPHRLGSRFVADGQEELGEPNIYIVRLIMPHEPEPRTTGQGSIYFFASGLAQEAVVQIADANRERVYSIAIDGLTGQARVYNYAFEPETLTEDAFDEDASELRDPG
jgi:hypothetical protein